MMKLLILAAAFAALATTVVAEPITTNRLAGETPVQAASHFLPQSTSQDIVAVDIEDPLFPGQPPVAVRFFASPKQVSPTACQRAVYYVSLKATGTAHPVISSQDVPIAASGITEAAQVALSADCAIRSKDKFAWVQPREKADDALGILHDLAAAQAAIKSGGVATVVFDCKTDIAPQTCSDGADAAFGKLPLDNIFLMNATKESWDITAQPAKVAQPAKGDMAQWYLSVSVEDGVVKHVTIRRGYPPPF